MGWKKSLIKEGTASGVVTTAGKAGKLRFLNFYGVTAQDFCEIRDGGVGGAIKATLVVNAIGNAYMGPFNEDDAPVFATDIYVKLGGTGTYQWNAVYDELT